MQPHSDSATPPDKADTEHHRPSSPAPTAERYVALAEVLGALAHPLRLRIVVTLCAGPKNVSALATSLGAKPAIISQQLRILRLHRLVARQRHDGYAVYRVRHPQLPRLVDCLMDCSDAADSTFGGKTPGVRRER